MLGGGGFGNVVALKIDEQVMEFSRHQFCLFIGGSIVCVFFLNYAHYIINFHCNNNCFCSKSLVTRFI